MARRDRMRSKKLRFSDSGSRFNDSKRFKPKVDRSPISKTFTRQIMFCKRCRSRVVSNVTHCPYCGKNLLPAYQRFWFWMIIVAATGVAVTALLFFMPGIPTVTKPDNPSPVVVGKPEGTSFKDLQPNTTISYNNLYVTVLDGYRVDTSYNGLPITAVEVSFYNTGNTPVTLYTTQWQLESDDGTRVDLFIGKNTSGEIIHSEFETRTLEAYSIYTTILYFALENPQRVLFAPNAVTYVEKDLVTWMLPTAEE